MFQLNLASAGRSVVMATAIAIGAVNQPTLAELIPPTNYPYAKFRQQLIQYGWVPNDTRGGCNRDYPEVCMANTIGSAYWRHPAHEIEIAFTLWSCPQVTCLAPPIQHME